MSERKSFRRSCKSYLFSQVWGGGRVWKGALAGGHRLAGVGCGGRKKRKKKRKKKKKKKKKRLFQSLRAKFDS